MMREDEPIVQYLRSRGLARPPMDLVGAVADAIADVPQERRSWFAPFIPAAAVAAGAAVVLIAAVLVGGDVPQLGPGPGGSPTLGESGAPPSAPPTPPSTPTIAEGFVAINEPGETVRIDAVDAVGTWGAVMVRRGEDVGGYGDESVSRDAFVVEVHVEYVPDREPRPLEFGRTDWHLVTRLDEPAGEPLRAGGRREATRPTLETYPGAIDIFANPLEGWLLFEVPRDRADEQLVLVYQPADRSEPVAQLPVRTASPAPDPVPPATPPPTPEPVTYVAHAEYPFTVIDSAEADELFEDPDTCTNPEVGYTITYPEAWFTNTEFGIWAPCTWFSPVFYTAPDDPEAVPPQVAIVLSFVQGSIGYFSDPEATVIERVTVGGFAATRMELGGAGTPDEERPFPADRYVYHVILAPQPAESPTLTAHTYHYGAADYTLNRAVLDRIMALIEFEER